MIFDIKELSQINSMESVEEFFIPFPKEVLKAIQRSGFATGFRLAHGKIEDMDKEKVKDTIDKFERTWKQLIENRKDDSFKGKVLTYLGFRGGSFGVNAYKEIDNLIELIDEYLSALKRKQKSLK